MPATGIASPAGPTSTLSAMATGGPEAGSTTATSPEGFTFRASAVWIIPELKANSQKALVRIAVTTAVAKTLNIAPPALRYELRLKSRFHHPRQTHDIPIRHAQTAVTLGLPNEPWFRRPVNAVMLFRQVEPGDPNHAVRSRGKLLLLL